MLSEALSTLTNLAREGLDASRAVQFAKVEKLPPNQIAVVKRDGTYEIVELDLPAPPRCHSLRSVSELEKFVTYAVKHLESNPSIWITGGAVTVLIDDKKGGWLDERAKIELTRSPQFDLLYKWEKTPQDFEHIDFLRTLRRYFANCIPNLDQLLKMLRKLQFQNGVALVSTVETKRQSLGKEITAAVGGDDVALLPEVLDLTVSVYDDASLNSLVVIKAMLDITPAGQFRLIPLAGQTLAAVDAALQGIQSQFVTSLVPDDVPVFFGSP